MTQEQVMGIFKQAIIMAVKMAGPLLAVTIIIGLVIAIFQAATQIHEQTLTFVPKIVAIALMMLLLGPWMITMLSDFMQNLFGMIPTL